MFHCTDSSSHSFAYILTHPIADTRSHSRTDNFANVRYKRTYSSSYSSTHAIGEVDPCVGIQR